MKLLSFVTQMLMGPYETTRTTTITSTNSMKTSTTTTTTTTATSTYELRSLILSQALLSHCTKFKFKFRSI